MTMVESHRALAIPQHLPREFGNVSYGRNPAAGFLGHDLEYAPRQNIPKLSGEQEEKNAKRAGVQFQASSMYQSC